MNKEQEIKKFIITETVLAEMREKVRENITATIKNDDDLNVLLEKKQEELSNLKIEEITDEQPSQFQRYFQLKFEIDTLQQRIYKNLLTIQQQENIRNQIFVNPRDLSKPKQTTNARMRYLYYLQYKYSFEYMELQLLKMMPQISFEDYREIIAVAQSLEQEALYAKIQRIEVMLENEVDLPRNSNLYNPDAELTDYSALKPNDILKIYKFVYLKTLHKTYRTIEPETNNNNNDNDVDSSSSDDDDDMLDQQQEPIRRAENTADFFYHSKKELEEIENKKEAAMLYQEGIALCEKMKIMDENDPNAKKTLEKAQEILQQAVEKGSEQAQRYLHSNSLFQFIMKFN